MHAPLNPPNSPSYPPDEAHSDHTADFRRVWHAMLERGWIIGISLVICVALGFAYIRRATVLYSATATVKVQQDQAPVFKIENVQFEDLQALDFLQTVAQSIKTRPLLERVIASNNLAADERFFSTAIKLSTTNKPVTTEDLAQALDLLTTVKLRRGTRLIDITVKHSSPQLTARLANSLVSEFMSENAEQHLATGTDAKKTLNTEAERLRKKLKESETALQAYKETNNAVSLDDRQNTVVAELKELSTKATEAKSLRIKLESDYSQVLALSNNAEALLTIQAVANDHSVVAAKTSLSKAESDFAALKQRYKAKHPKYIQAQTQLTALQEDLAQSASKAAQGLKSGLDAARASETALESARRTQETAALKLNDLSIQYGVLAREVESDRALYESVLKTMKESDVTKEIKPMKIHVVQQAYVPDKPVAPRRAMIMAMSAMVGLGLGILAVLSFSFLDSSIKTVDEAESLLRLPVLGTTAKLKEVNKNNRPLLVVDAPHSTGAESFRTLRTNLSMLGRIEDRRVFLFTSAMPQEGKTFTSVNYAASLAHAGLKTLIIDGDLRRPNVEATLSGKETDAFGVTDFLTSNKSFEEVIQTTRVPNLFIIAGGTTAPNPAELLAKDGLSSLIARALRDYDRVVVDSAPIHAVSDTLLMVKHVQTVCLVIRAAHTSFRSVTRCIQLLQGAAAPLSGMVLNRMPVRRRLGYGYDSGYYDYGYHGKYSKKGVYGA